MTFRQLHYFCVIANSDSFGKAAESLGVTQPAISRKLSDLEAELDTILFERTAQGPKLTACGQILYDSAMAILNIEKQVIQKINNYKQTQKNIIHLGFQNLFEKSSLQKQLSIFESTQNISLSIYEHMNLIDGAQLLKKGALTALIAWAEDIDKIPQGLKNQKIIKIVDELLWVSPCHNKNSSVVLVPKVFYIDSIQKQILNFNPNADIQICEPESLTFFRAQKLNCHAIIPSWTSSYLADFKDSWLTERSLLIETKVLFSADSHQEGLVGFLIENLLAHKQYHYEVNFGFLSLKENTVGIDE